MEWAVATEVEMIRATDADVDNSKKIPEDWVTAVTVSRRPVDNCSTTSAHCRLVEGVMSQNRIVTKVGDTESLEAGRAIDTKDLVIQLWQSSVYGAYGWPCPDTRQSCDDVQCVAS